MATESWVLSPWFLEGLHEVARVQRGQGGCLCFGESQAGETLPASLVHVLNKLKDTSRPLPQGLVLPRPGRHQEQRIKDFVVKASRVAQRIVTPAYRIRKARVETGLARQMLTEMGEAKRHVPCFVLGRHPPLA